MNSRIGQCLLSRGLLTPEKLQAAEEHASKANTSMEEAVIDLKLVQPADLGDCLSEMHMMPYLCLAGKLPPRNTGTFFSKTCIRRWEIFPVTYDARASLLTLAVSSPEKARRMESISAFMLEPHDLAFVISPRREILEAIRSNFEPAQPIPEPAGTTKTPTVPVETQIETDTPKAKPSIKVKIAVQKQEPAPAKPSLKIPRVEAAAEIRREEPPAGKPQEPSDEILKSLTSAVSLLVSAHLSANPEELNTVKTRVRYCQLTATRLNLTASRAVQVILAAWLSALENKREIIRQFDSPYDLERIIFGSGPGDAEQPVESLILSLVRCFQDFQKKSPADARDINLVRRGLHLNWRSADKQQDLIETLLQVMIDEQFLDKLGKQAGTVLLVDPDPRAGTGISDALKRTGYNVQAIPSVTDAHSFALESPPDIIIARTESKANDILTFCRLLNADPASAAIPLIALVSQNSPVKGTEFMRAGADDFLVEPVDVELLYLKMEKLSTTAAPETNRKGVSGSLSDMCFSDLVQVLSAGCKSMEILVTRGAEKGRIFMKEGNVVHAENGGITGEQAFYRLMGWRNGEFSMEECSQFPEPTITSSTMSLLMEGARLDDEKNAG